ncbi:hypothetical protein ACHWQZ_G006812 [Mnemiopsis leidyi]
MYFKRGSAVCKEALCPALAHKEDRGACARCAMNHLLSCCICQSKKDKEKKNSCTRDGENTVQSAQPENNVRQEEAAAPQERGAVAPRPRVSNTRSESGVRSRHGSTKSRQGDKTPSKNTDVETGPPADYQ